MANPEKDPRCKRNKHDFVGAGREHAITKRQKVVGYEQMVQCIRPGCGITAKRSRSLNGNYKN